MQFENRPLFQRTINKSNLDILFPGSGGKGSIFAWPAAFARKAICVGIGFRFLFNRFFDIVNVLMCCWIGFEFHLFLQSLVLKRQGFNLGLAFNRVLLCNRTVNFVSINATKSVNDDNTKKEGIREG